jgi:hypothetical protein
MDRFVHATVAVVGCILLGGLLGGYVGRTVGRISPSFVKSLAPVRPRDLPADFNPAEFGLGLGIVSGLFFGAGTGLFLVFVLVVRDAWLARFKMIEGQMRAVGP